MKILHSTLPAKFTLFEKRFCFQNNPDKPDEGIKSIQIEKGYADKQKAEEPINEIEEKAKKRVDSAMAAPSVKAKVNGKLEALRGEAARKLEEIDQSQTAEPEKQKQRAEVIKNYQGKIASYIGSPGEEHEIEITMKDKETGETTTRTEKKVVDSQVFKSEGYNGYDVAQGVVTEGSKEKDPGGESLQSLLATVEKANLEWRGGGHSGEGSEDRSHVLNTIAKLFGDDIGRGYLAYAKDNDTYVAMPLNQWISAYAGKEPSYEDVMDLTHNILPKAREKIEADTAKFRKEMSEAQFSLDNAKKALDSAIPVLDGAFSKPSYEITLVDKINFDTLKEGKTNDLRTVFNEKRAALISKISGLKDKLKPVDGQAPDLDKTRGDILLDLKLKEAALAGIIISANASIDSVSTQAQPLKTIDSEVSELEKKVTEYSTKITSSPETPSGAPSGDIGGTSAGGTGGVAAGGAPEGGKEVTPASITTKYFEKKRPSGYKKDFIEPNNVEKKVPKWMRTQAEKMLAEASKSGTDQRGYYYLYPNGDQNKEPNILVRIMRPEGKQKLELRFYQKEETSSAQIA